MAELSVPQAKLSQVQQRRPQHGHARQPLRILLSAYACEPDRGSEPGIGWQWATRLAELGHEIVVITRANNAAAIDAAMSANHIPTLHFVYIDLPKWASFWKRSGRGVHLYYFLWQFFSFPTAYRLHRKWRFDIVHHLTFGVFRQPSWLALLDAPCVFGPVGGGEKAPRSLRKGMPMKSRLAELARDIANLYAKIDPMLSFALKRTTTVLCKTEETRSALPRSYLANSEVFVEIGTEPKHDQSAAKRFLAGETASHESPRDETPTPAIRVLYVGRLIHWKGLHFALPAFAQLLREFPDSRFTIVGRGPQEPELRRLTKQLKIEHRVDWMPWLPHDEVLTEYGKHDVFLFPSLHDSSGNAVLEAMTNGLPVVCLKLGGPATIVDCFSGIRIDTQEPELAIQHLGSALALLAGNPSFRNYLSQGAYARANNYFSWRSQIDRMTALYYSLYAQRQLSLQT
jgi:glycosyltransferase involved in cell wall biosynthesis